MSTPAILRHRRDTAANWTSNNPVLEAGQIGYETDTRRFKFGNGSTAWTSLAYGVGALADGDVTYAKIQDTSAGSVLLGRGSSGAGDVQEITVGSGLVMTGTTLTATGGGGGAPSTADYLVKTADAGLSAERVVTDSTSITANWSTAGQVAFQRAALTGDVTATANSNATTIANGVVSTAKMGGDVTTAGKALLDDADAAAQRTTLGLGTLATQSGTFSGTSSGTNTGDQTITLTGDVTGSGTGSFAATIASGAVSTSKLGGDITTAGKALLDDADASAQRTTLGLGTLATQSGTFSGTSSGTNTGDQTITLTGDVTGSGTGSFAATIANSAVSYAKIQNVSATDKLLGRSTAGAGVVQEITCTAAGRALIDDADAAAQRTTLGLGALATGGDGDKGDITVSSSGATWTIDNDAVTYAKMQNISATSRVLGRKTAGSGDTEECTLSEVLDFVGSAAQGDILYRGASTWTRLGAGTSGHYLKTNGTGADPAWAAVAGGGSSAQVDTYTTTGTVHTWTKPTGAKSVQIIAQGAGGGGGGGSCQATTAAGGAGGGGGAFSLTTWRADDLPASLYVIVGTGGTSGAGGDFGSSGVNGGAGGNTTVADNNTNPPTAGVFAMGGGGGGGKQGIASTNAVGGGGGGTGGQGTTGSGTVSVNGGAPNPNTTNASGGSGAGGFTNNAGRTAEWGGGGGCGNSYTNSNVFAGGYSMYGGGGGGSGGMMGSNPQGAAGGGSGITATGGGSGGATGGGAGGNGSDAGTTRPSGGGGGGGGRRTTAEADGTGGAGGNGGFPSGGGGGGGNGKASATGTFGGAGGTGANGRCIIITYF